MKRHINYLKYVLRHKWFVFLACIKLGVPIWRAIIHDWHKFLPCEWFPYAYTFYNADGSKRYEENQSFTMAWNHHQKMGNHHWQYWLITWDRGNTEPIDMPSDCIREMIADWWGAGRAITGNWDAVTWYDKNKSKIILTPVTRRLTETWLYESESKFETPDVIAQRKRVIGY